MIDDHPIPASVLDELAQEIRRVDGDNTMGAGQLAEALMPFLARIGMKAEGSGWKLVPVEPTEAMLWRGWNARKPESALEGMRSAYSAMLAAAPEPGDPT